MEKQKTPLARLNSHIDERIIDTELNYPENDWNGGYVTAMREIKDKIKELLPEERKMVEDAYDDGMANGYDDGKYDDEPKYKTSEDYFDKTYEQ